jgi:hypothetical protein
MKSFLFYIAILLLSSSFIACNKDDDTITPPATINKTWKLGSTTYTVNNYARANETFQAYDAAGNGVHFSFSTYPTADGTYNVVSSSATLGANDVSVLAFGSSSGTSYFSTGNDNTKATIKVVSSSTLRVTLPDTWVAKPGADSLKLSANLGDL